MAAAAQRRLRLRPPLAPSAPRGPPAASRVPEPPAQHGSRAAEPHGRPSYSPVGSRSPGRSKAAGRRGAAGPWGDRETAAAALVRLRARRFLSLGGCGLTPPPVPRSERERRKKKKKTFIETIQPAAAAAAAARSDRLRELPHPRLHCSPGAARPLPAAAGRGGALLGAGLMAGAWPERGGGIPRKLAPQAWLQTQPEGRGPSWRSDFCPSSPRLARK